MVCSGNRKCDIYVFVGAVLQIVFSDAVSISCLQVRCASCYKGICSNCNATPLCTTLYLTACLLRMGTDWEFLSTITTGASCCTEQWRYIAKQLWIVYGPYTRMLLSSMHLHVARVHAFAFTCRLLGSTSKLLVVACSCVLRVKRLWHRWTTRHHWPVVAIELNRDKHAQSGVHGNAFMSK